MVSKQWFSRFVQTVRFFLTLGVVVLAGGAAALAADWPTYRHDAARSGITSEQLQPPLSECWVFKARHAPQPAWGDPKPQPVEGILELRRVHFDDVFQPVAADGAVFFGSSADNKVYCLEAATGRIRWTRITGGPVRLAPMVSGGRVFVGSDDGYAYCLSTEDGSVRWKFHAAPEDRRVLGHGKMISLWPLRSGVLVDEGIAYFAAGIFPAEGVFLYAVGAKNGRRLWRNDTCGENPQSLISPQGYLLASKSNLYVPMGRASPAAFDRADGRLLYETNFGHRVGGTYALLTGEHIYTGTEQMVAYDRKTRDEFASFLGRKMVVTSEAAYLATDTQLIAMDRKKKDKKKPTVRWKIPCRCSDALILAGKVLFAGGTDRVIAVDAATGKQIWTGKVEGTAKGLAVAAGRLLVSTDKGMIYCFGPEGSPRHGLVTEPVNDNPFANSPHAAMFEQAAETILKETGVKRGFCLVLGLETGQLALELAKRSELMIYAVSPDGDKVAAARKALDAAGLYGARVCVEEWPPDKVPYSDYFANLIVSETAVITGELPGKATETFRMLKPIGGTIMIGQPADRSAGAKPLQAEALREWLAQSKLKDGQVVVHDGNWMKITRGPLPGAGSWSHQYANAGNTACGDDLRLKCPLGVLWFGRPGPGNMVNRHARAAGPLSIDGRLFVQGENTVMAYDVYNGLKLWQRDIPGAVRVAVAHDSSNLALNRDGLFVAVGEKCLRLDPATGQTKATYQVPPAPDGKQSRWGYVGCTEKLLFGSRVAGRFDSECIFALDIDSKEQRWIYNGTHIPHNTIAIGDGRVFLVSSNVTADGRKAAVEDARRRIHELPVSQRAKAEKVLARPDVRLVVALDAKTGKLLWERPTELNRASGKSNSGSMTQAAMYHNGVLVLFGVYLNGHYWPQFLAGEFDTRQITALSGEDGKLIWSKPIGYRVRPLVIGDTLHAEPWAFDLHTGKQKMRLHPITGKPDRWQFARGGHCGSPAASPNCLFFRSNCLGYYDLPGDYGMMHFGSLRPGCWINFIAAGGLLLMPEASTGCMCTFPHTCSIVFKPTEKTKGWAMYSAPGPMTPVRRLAINFGAPGDRNDAAGKLWLGYPRPGLPFGRLVLPLKIDVSFHPGGRFVRGNSVYAPVTGTDDPWLFAMAAYGLRKCAIPLRAKSDGTATYRIRLALADPECDQPGRRVFDIKLQGKLVQENFDIVKETGGRNRAVFKQFNGIVVAENLVIELVPKAEKPTPQQLPILQGVEILRQP